MLRLLNFAGRFLVAAIAAVIFQFSSAWADDGNPTGVSSAASGSKTHLASSARPSNEYNSIQRYFVEFRARNAASYGHIYVMYGEVNSRQEVTKSHVAGFFPAGDRRDCANCSVYAWTIGHLIFVPSEIGASDGDLEEKYVLTRYRVWVDAATYKRLVAYINKLEIEKPLWNAWLRNCVGFTRDVAELINLKVPFFILAKPESFVTDLREANGLAKEQLPLRDAPVKVGAAVKPVPKTAGVSQQEQKIKSAGDTAAKPLPLGN